MWQQIITTITAVITVMLGIFGYERMKNKDNSSITTTLAILMTKVDSLLSMSNDVKRLEEKVIRHDEEIKNLKDTSRFAKITDEMMRGASKND